MALDANTYGTLIRVQNMIGDIVTDRQFSGSTNPSIEKVENALDDIADTINMELKQQDYTVPVTLADDPEAFKFLRFANSAGAAAALLSFQPFEAGPGGFSAGSGDSITSRRNYLQSVFKKALETIRADELPASRATGLFANIVAGSREDDDGNIKQPIFTRDIFDIPGGRSLTKDS